MFRHISDSGFSTRVIFSTDANFSVSTQIGWKVLAPMSPAVALCFSSRCAFAYDKILLQK